MCAPTIKKTCMELGGNAPFIVFDDADLDAAVEGAMASKYRNTGQTCVCANRILVQDGVYDAFAGKLKAAVEATEGRQRHGGRRQPGPADQRRRRRQGRGAHRRRGQARRARSSPAASATRWAATSSSRRCWPNVPPDALIFHEETFGPVAPLFRFKTEEEAIRLANDTEFGLASYFYARDIGRIFRVAEALEYGIVGINEGIISTAEAPFGGMKQSGLGREGSKYGIEDYLEVKYLCVGRHRNIIRPPAATARVRREPSAAIARPKSRHARAEQPSRPFICFAFLASGAGALAQSAMRTVLDARNA